ncbi:MAG: hypothetical protein ACFFCE_15560 [Promethearchaeota archaeon]
MIKKSDVINCPVCGFSFQFDIKESNLNIECPMCGYKFKDSGKRFFSSKDLKENGF